MPRPGNISKEIHDKVQVYSVVNDLNMPEAYEQVLTIGLTNTEDIDQKSVEKLSRFAESKDLDKTEALEMILDGILEGDGSVKSGTIIKNLSIEELNR